MSEGLKLFIGIFVILLLAAVAVFFIYYNGMTTAVFSFCLKRNDPEKWQRGCSDPSDAILFSMNEAGETFAKENKTALISLETVSDKLRLSADYYDLGNDKAVIIIPPFSETSSYSRYFANTYAKLGFNILLPDNRATGNSAGEFISVGYFESDDILAWAESLNKKYGLNNILLHGISSGAVAAMIAGCNKALPLYIKGAVYEGIYPDYSALFKNLMLKKRYNTLVHNAVIRKMKRYIGVDNTDISPAYFAENAKLPALFISGMEDDLVDAEEAKTVYEMYGSSTGITEKEFITFEKGENGKLRYSDTEIYDECISEFCSKMF